VVWNLLRLLEMLSMCTVVDEEVLVVGVIEVPRVVGGA
jgi:hypothetical protein